MTLFRAPFYLRPTMKTLQAYIKVTILILTTCIANVNIAYADSIVSVNTAYTDSIANVRSAYADSIAVLTDEPTGGAEYKGLYYSYIYKSGTKQYYTNKENNELKTYLESFSAQVTSQNYRADSLLADPSVNSKTVYYKFIGGATKSLASSEKGVMTIVNDFGAAYNYRTIGISPTVFHGNEDVKEIRFQDLADNYATETYYPLRLVIPDRAFNGCKNLKTLNMFYYITKGSNHYEALGPENIFIGKDVFDGCSEDFTIRVAPERLQDFLDDPDWARYKNHIRPWEYAPTDQKAITEEGVVYDYAATLVNNLPNDKVMKLRYSLVNLPTLAVKTAIVTAATMTVVGGATTYLGLAENAFSNFAASWAVSSSIAYGAAITGAYMEQAGYDGAGYILQMLLSYIGSSSGSATKALIEKKMMSGAFKAAGKSVIYGTIVKSCIGSYNKMTSNLSAMIEAGMALSNTKGLQSASFEDTQLDNIGNSTDYPDYDGVLSLWNKQRTRNPYVIYKMYIKGVDGLKNGKMNIYNDVGSVYNYRTVAIGEEAVKGNKDIKSITFTDVYGSGAESYVPLYMTVPDYAFKDCENLETLNMFIRMKYHVDKEYPLGPNNFRLLGEHVFDNCPNLKIRIAREKYQEFMNDSIWSKYKDRFELVDWTEPNAFSERGCSYAYNLTGNSLFDKTDNNTWRMHITGPSSKDVEEIDITTDPGTVSSYHTTYVARKAFLGHSTLKKIHFWDMTTYLPATNHERTAGIELRDSCFANCKSLETICMMYHTYEGSNNVYPLSPKSIMLGKGVFDGCRDDFKILVAAEYYADFMSDPGWMQYADHIIPFFYKPSDKGAGDITKTGYNKYDGYSLYDYYIPTQLKANSDIEDKYKKALQSLNEYSLLSYISTNDGDYNKSVPDKQFAGFTNLQRINIPYTVERIGTNAFEGTALHRIQLNELTTSIGANAFKDCSKLKVVEMHCDKPSLVTIDETAFTGVPSDYVITVPDTLVDEYKRCLPHYAAHINGNSAYPDETGLVTIQCSETGDIARHFGCTAEVTGAFDNSLYTINFKGGNDTWKDIDSLKVTGPIDQSDLLFIYRMTADLGSLRHLDLSEATMQYRSFTYNGKNVDLCLTDRYVQNILPIADTESKGLKSFTLPDEFLNNLTTLYYSKDYMSGTVMMESSLRKLVFPKGFAGLSRFEISDIDHSLDIAFLDDKVPSASFVSTNKEKVNLYVPYSLKTSFENTVAFNKYSGSINSLFMDDELFRIPTCKAGLYTLSDITTDSLFGTWFKDDAKVKNLDDLHRFANITVLPDNAFNGCSALERIAIPYSVRSIGAHAFDGCHALKSVTMLCDTVPTLVSESATADEQDIFKDLPSDFKIYVTDAMLEKYLNSWQWTKYRNHIVSFLQTDDLKMVTVTAPGQLATKLGLTITTSGNRITQIDGAGLRDIRRLKVNGPLTDTDLAVLHFLTGRLPNSDLEVNDAQLRYLDLGDARIVKPTGTSHRFANNSSATVDDDDVLPSYLFYDCDRLEKLILPKGVRKAKAYSLSKCNNLNTVVFGESMEEVCAFALEDSPRLGSIAITSRNVPAFSSKAFGSTAGILYNKHNFVDNIHTPRTLQKHAAATKEIQEHALHVRAYFDDDAMFRTLAMHCVLDTMSAAHVDCINGWFTGNDELKDARQLRVFSGVKTIGDSLFLGCKNLERAVMPGNITALGNKVFDGCDRLIYVDMTDCEKLGIDHFSRTDGIFVGTPEKTLVYMPDGNTSRFDEINVINTSGGISTCHDYRITDDDSTIDVPRAFHADRASTMRTFSQGVKSTVFLPYGLSAEQTSALGKFYAYKSFSSETNEVTFERVTATEPNTAYLFVPDAAQIEAEDADVACSKESDPNETEFVGTYHLMTIEGNPWAYGYAGEKTEATSEGQFVHLTDGATIPPMRAYLQLRGMSPTALSLTALLKENGSIDGIATITVDGIATDTMVNVYNTDGKAVRISVRQSECLKGLPGGTYIVNGKKFIR